MMTLPEYLAHLAEQRELMVATRGSCWTLVDELHDLRRDLADDPDCDPAGLTAALDLSMSAWAATQLAVTAIDLAVPLSPDQVTARVVDMIASSITDADRLVTALNDELRKVGLL